MKAFVLYFDMDGCRPLDLSGVKRNRELIVHRGKVRRGYGIQSNQLRNDMTRDFYREIDIKCILFAFLMKMEAIKNQADKAKEDRLLMVLPVYEYQKSGYILPHKPILFFL